MSVALNPEAPEFLPANFESSIETGFATMCRTIRLSNSLPIGIAYKEYEVIPDFNTVTKKFNHNVIYQLNSILKSEPPFLKLSENELGYNMERLTFANDSILDRFYSNIDCLKKGIEPTNLTNFYSPIITTIKVGSTTFTGGKNIILPQLLFKDKVDNSSSLWVPKISDKPNSITPLALQILYNENKEAIGYEHPYKDELSTFQPKPEWLTPDVEKPTMPPPPEETKLTFVATEVELNELLKHLETVEELSVDLEHHSYRSFQGFTCLIQITTVGGDFIVDALALREHLHKLNEVFTNPKKLKIFHGANNDVQWLQRDFGVYVVGLFDTYQAAQVLNLPRKSLMALLKLYCGLDIDKSHQLADWRLRPLTDSMMLYARSDTHYLLYIWRRMQAELIALCAGKPQQLLEVFEQSRQVCCLTYNKEVLNDDSHLTMVKGNKRHFNSQQMAALRSLYRWRHEQACTLDESTTYLLPNHMLYALAKQLPKEVQGVCALCCPTPPFVKQNLYTIHRMILTCRALPLEPVIVRPVVKVARIKLPPVEFDVHDILDDEGEEKPKQDSTGSGTDVKKPEATFAEIVSFGLSDAVTPVVSAFHDEQRNKKVNDSEDTNGVEVAPIVKENEQEQKTVVAETSKPPDDGEIPSTSKQTIRKLTAATDSVNELSTNETADNKDESHPPTTEDKRPPAEVLLGGLKKKNKNKKSHEKNKRYNVQNEKFSEQSSHQNKNPTVEITNSVPKKNSSRKKRQQGWQAGSPGMTQGYQHVSLSKTVPNFKPASRDTSQKRNPKPYVYEDMSYIKFLETKKNDTKTQKYKK